MRLIFKKLHCIKIWMKTSHMSVSFRQTSTFCIYCVQTNTHRLSQAWRWHSLPGTPGNNTPHMVTTAWLPLSARPHTYMLPWCIHTHKDTNDRWVNTTHFTPTHGSEESDNYWKKKERRFVYLFINPFVHQCLLVSFFSLTWYPSCRSLHLFSLCKWLVNITSLILSDLLKTWAMESLCRLCLLCEHWEVLQCHKLYSKKFRTKTFFWEKWEDGHCEYMYGGEEGEEWEMEGGRERHRWEWLSGSRWVT